MRPLGETQTRLVETFKGDFVIYAVNQGDDTHGHNVLLEILKILDTKLPDDLILVHEHGDHYSLQPAKVMTVAGKSPCPDAQGKHDCSLIPQDLNKRITDFLQQNATTYTKEQWLFNFRDGWEWSEEHGDHFRCKDDGGYEWYQSVLKKESKGKGKVESISSTSTLRQSVSQDFRSLQKNSENEGSSQAQTATASFAGHGQTVQDVADPQDEETYQEEMAGLVEDLDRAQIQEDETPDAHPFYVDVYRSGKRVCFINPEGKEVKTDEIQWEPWTTEYEGEPVPCYLYIGPKSKRRFYTWDVREEKEKKGKKGKGKKH